MGQESKCEIIAVPEVASMMNERQIASGIAAPQCGSCFSRHKIVVIIAALGCGGPGGISAFIPLGDE